ncbi:MAG: DUF4405 domain-containing protein [Acidobacteriota bacterium]
MEKRNFNKRAFISSVLFISGAGLPFSGYMNHILGFSDMDASRHAWMSVHNVLGVLFVAFALWHIALNWKVMKIYFRKAAGLIISRETLYAASLILICVGMFVFHAVHLAR